MALTVVLPILVTLMLILIGYAFYEYFKGKESSKEEELLEENEKNTVSHWNPTSPQGIILNKIAQSPRTATWKELQDSTNFNKDELNKAISDLIYRGDILKTMDIDDKWVRYYAREEYHPDASIQISKVDEELDWINQWKELNKLDFDVSNRQFFLESKFLGDFSKTLISNTKSHLLIANPYIHQCNLSDALADAKKRGINVQIITQRPRGRTREEQNDREKYHLSLEEEGISLNYNNRIHAKIIIADNAVALVSSLNFFANSEAGTTWEAGMVTTDKNTAEDIYRALTSMLIKKS